MATLTAKRTAPKDGDGDGFTAGPDGRDNVPVTGTAAAQPTTADPDADLRARVAELKARPTPKTLEDAEQYRADARAILAEKAARERARAATPAPAAPAADAAKPAATASPDAAHDALAKSVRNSEVPPDAPFAASAVQTLANGVAVSSARLAEVAAGPTGTGADALPGLKLAANLHDRADAFTTYAANNGDAVRSAGLGNLVDDGAKLAASADAAAVSGLAKSLDRVREGVPAVRPAEPTLAGLKAAYVTDPGKLPGGVGPALDRLAAHAGGAIDAGDGLTVFAPAKGSPVSLAVKTLAGTRELDAGVRRYRDAVEDGTAWAAAKAEPVTVGSRQYKRLGPDAWLGADDAGTFALLGADRVPQQAGGAKPAK